MPKPTPSTHPSLLTVIGCEALSDAEASTLRGGLLVTNELVHTVQQSTTRIVPSQIKVLILG